MAGKSVTIYAPAKINLFLHVTGKRENGYHELESLIAFSDICDKIEITAADQFSLSISNPFSEIDINHNLVKFATEALSKATDIPLNCQIHLDKKIPIGAGLGGGSADAAATIKGLLRFWQKDIKVDQLNSILLSLGADVPACYHDTAIWVGGIGEKIEKVTHFNPLFAVLVYPNIHCSTPEIFKKLNQNFTPLRTVKGSDLDFIKEQKNDLQSTAIKQHPVIQDTLDTIQGQKGCVLSRMSGSGSCSFGLFNHEKDSREAAQKIQNAYPDWWVRPALLK